VNDTRSVRRVEGGGYLNSDRECLFERYCPLFEPRCERLALEILHDEELEPVLLTDIEQWADVRMAERRNHSGFAFEPLAKLGVASEVSGKYLDSDDAIEPGVAGPVDLAHSAGAERLNDFIRTETSPPE
jgi:hypothetical protein